MTDPRLLIPRVAGIQCDVATLEAAIAEAEADFAALDDWKDHEDCRLPTDGDDVEE